jgi:hypothetical protein
MPLTNYVYDQSFHGTQFADLPWIELFAWEAVYVRKVMMQSLVVLGALACAAALPLQSAQASPVIVSTTLPQNDCAGTFGGTRGTTCAIPDSVTVNGTTYTGLASPIIAKATPGNGGTWTWSDINFSSITGSEFTISFNAGTTSSGTWNYTPGPNDPGVTAWVAKGGNNFQLFFSVPKTAVSSGVWSTPNGEGLSHITFYDTALPNGPGGDPNQTGVPVPGALALFGVALLGLGVARRARRAA